MQKTGSKDLEAERNKKYKYYTDARGEHEIELTNKLTRALSELNTTALDSQPLHPSASPTLKKEDFLYVLLPGAPPFPNEFGLLQLPGQTLFFPLTCFEEGRTVEELQAMRTEFDEQAKILNSRINQVSQTKRLVFVCHSYGCYVFAVYCQMFSAERIVGIIDVGGAPISFYPAIKNHVHNVDTKPLSFHIETLDEAYRIANETNKINGVKGFANKYILLGMVRSIVSGVGFKDMFEYNRNLPKVLKCFIFGRNDHTFPEKFLNEKVVHYSYKNKPEGEYDVKLQKTYERCFRAKCNNVQERFIYSIEGAQHAIHMQKKYKDLMVRIVNRYLTFLEEVHTQSPAL